MGEERRESAPNDTEGVNKFILKKNCAEQEWPVPKSFENGHFVLAGKALKYEGFCPLQ